MNNKTKKYLFIGDTGAMDQNSSDSISPQRNKSEPMCSTLKEMGRQYSKQHGYIALAVCVFGILANFLNILVLTRKQMNESPINKILAGTF